jgi:hypothetical protein
VAGVHLGFDRAQAAEPSLRILVARVKGNDRLRAAHPDVARAASLLPEALARLDP